jgi:hypothetical protein
VASTVIIWVATTVYQELVRGTFIRAVEMTSEQTPVNVQGYRFLLGHPLTAQDGDSQKLE